jgi:hypothetical protein
VLYSIELLRALAKVTAVREKQDIAMTYKQVKSLKP